MRPSFMSLSSPNGSLYLNFFFAFGYQKKGVLKFEINPFRLLLLVALVNVILNAYYMVVHGTEY